ncbi:MAG: ketoacyl-ACP synthase III [Gemmatimonadetes bacterium]|nr:ketoacyl-ACP synthase III [Gemmatimonadota bacterium]
MKRPIAEFGPTACYIPTKVATNADFEQMFDTSDEWILERTGIRERHWASDEETIAFMATEASKRALDEAGLTPEDVDAIVVGTASWDRLLPSQACDIQAVLGATNAAAFDVGAACSGFLYAVSVAEGMIASGTGEQILVIGAERLTRIADYTDRSTAILFGDGAGVVLMRPATDGTRGILSIYLKTDGRLGDLLYRSGGGSLQPPGEVMEREHGYFIKMAGREVFKHAVRLMADACDQALRRAGLTVDDIDLLIPHQANIRIIEATAKRAGIPKEKVYINVDRFGNTSAASIPIALDEAVRAGRIGPGSIVLLVAFGGGLTWASIVIRW